MSSGTIARRPLISTIPRAAGQTLAVLRAKPNTCFPPAFLSTTAGCLRLTNAIPMPCFLLRQCKPPGRNIAGDQLLLFQPVGQKRVMTGVIFVGIQLDGCRRV